MPDKCRKLHERSPLGWQVPPRLTLFKNNRDDSYSKLPRQPFAGLENTIPHIKQKDQRNYEECYFNQDHWIQSFS